MSSVVIKIGSLVIKTLSKPIANQIKQQAREHERFRTFCIGLAQRLHRWDMRFRLGLLQDQAAIDKQIAKEAAERAAEKHKHPKATAKTEAETKTDEEAAAKAKDKTKEKPVERPRKLPRIRELSEVKAIDSGANFVSETFLLMIAVGCVVGERWYSSKKETSRREDVAEQLEELKRYEKAARKGMVEMEREILRLRVKAGDAPAKPGSILPKEVYELEQSEEGQPEPASGLFARIAAYISRSQENDNAEKVVEKPKEDPRCLPEPTSKPSGVLDRIVQSTGLSTPKPKEP